MLSPSIDLTGGNSTDKAHRAASLLRSRPEATGEPQDHPVIMTLPPRARAQADSGLGLKRPERRRRRWRLWFRHRINEVGDDLGMHQAMSQSPSKPVAPEDGHCRGHSMGAVGEVGKPVRRAIQPWRCRRSLPWQPRERPRGCRRAPHSPFAQPLSHPPDGSRRHGAADLRRGRIGQRNAATVGPRVRQTRVLSLKFAVPIGTPWSV